MKPAIKTGAVLGTAGAINVELGFIPTYVVLVQSDGLLRTEAWLQWTVPFTSAGTAVPLAGHTIRGATSAARATIKEVMLASGTYAAGTAAGFFVLEEGSLVGTFGSENIIITNLASGTVGTDDATVTANVTRNVAIAAAAAPATTAATTISRYEGTAAGASKGFTIGATLSATGQLLSFTAFRDNT